MVSVTAATRKYFKPSPGFSDGKMQADAEYMGGSLAFSDLGRFIDRWWGALEMRTGSECSLLWFVVESVS